MNIKRKGASIAFTATLLASLLATVAAPLASAAATVTTPAGNVPAGGTSATAAVINVLENTAPCYTSLGPGAVAPDPGVFPPGPELTFTVRDSAGNPTISWSNLVLTTPPPGSMSGFTIALASAGGTNDQVVVNFTNSDDVNQELFAFSANLTASAAAAPGAIQLFVDGNQAGCVRPGGTTPASGGTITTSGLLAAAELLGAGDGVPAGDNLELISVTPCAFAITAGTLPSTLRVGSDTVPTQTHTVTAAGALVGGAQTINIAAPGLTAGLPANTAVFQTVPNCTLGPLGTTLTSPGTVVVALTVTAASTPIVLPGENNQVAGNVTVSEAPSGASLNGQTLTFTISQPAAGVVFSNSPGVSYAGGASGPGVCAISADRRSCTVGPIVGTAALGESVTLGTALNPIRYDVAQNVPLGTAVRLTVSTSPAVALISGTVTNAFVGRVVVSSAAQPTVFIGFNDQPTGVITFTESGVGFFTAGGGGNNVFGLCPLTGESFTRAPHARVVNAGAGAGQSNLLLLNPATATGVTLQQGTLAPSTAVPGVTCAYWTIHTASTTNPAVIEIVGADTANVALPGGAGNPTNGPRINVPNGSTPGSVQFALNIGSQAQVLGAGGFSQIVSNAVRAFRNNITVVAVSQPRCAKGSTDCLAGNIRITETQAGQFKPGDRLTVRILPRATTQRQDVILKTGVTNDLPILTPNTPQSGLAVGPVSVNCPPSALLGTVVCEFTMIVTQQAFATSTTLGSIEISNIHYVVAADAIDGPVLVEVMLTPGPGSVGQPADTVVSNAIIGLAPAPGLTAILSGIAPGVNRSNCGTDNAGCPFRSATAIVNSGAPGAHAYATARWLVAGTGNRGVVDVWVLVRTGLNPVLPQGFPGAYTRRTGVPVTANGYAYYFADAKLLTANGPGRASIIGVVRATATYASSRSKAVSVVFRP